MFKSITKILFLFLIIYSSNVFAKINTKQINSINMVVEKYITAYENRDYNAIVSLYAPNALAIGTGNAEVIQGRAEMEIALKRDFSESTKSQITMKKIRIDIKNDIAIASYYLTVNVKVRDSAPFKSVLRLTLGLVKENNKWVIIQSHLSAPLDEQKNNTSFPKLKT